MTFIDFQKALHVYTARDIIFIGLGNDIRGDDGAGLVFLDRLKQKTEFEESIFIRARTNPENYLQKIVDSQAKLVVFIDACHWGGKPGEMTWLDGENINKISISTHAFSIKMVEEFICAQKNIEFKYLGIEPKSMEIGEPLSGEVCQHMNAFF